MIFKRYIKYPVKTGYLLFLLIQIIHANDSGDDETYNVGGVLADYGSEEHFREIISVSQKKICMFFINI